MPRSSGPPSQCPNASPMAMNRTRRPRRWAPMPRNAKSRYPMWFAAMIAGPRAGMCSSPVVRMSHPITRNTPSVPATMGR